MSSQRLGDESAGALEPLAATCDFACVDPDKPVARGRIVAVRADGPGSATRVRLMAVEADRSVRRLANPGRPNMEVTRANETMMRAVAVFVGRAVRGATPRHYRPAVGSGRSRRLRHVAGGENPVVTGRQSGLAASRAKGFAKKIVGARVMTRC